MREMHLSTFIFHKSLDTSELMVDLLRFLQVVRATASVADVEQSRYKGLFMCISSQKGWLCELHNYNIMSFQSLIFF